MDNTDLNNASYYYELYIFDYLLKNKYISAEEYDRIIRECQSDSGIFYCV